MSKIRSKRKKLGASLQLTFKIIQKVEKLLMREGLSHLLFRIMQKSIVRTMLLKKQF